MPTACTLCSKEPVCLYTDPGSDRIGEFDLKLMDIDTEHLGIPDTEYDAVVKLSSNEFARICRDLSNVGESVKITITKEGVTFSTEGEIGDARMTLKQGSGSAARLDDDDDAGLDDDDADKPTKKRRTDAGSSSSTGGVVPVEIQLEKAVALTFSVQYLVNFTKAAPLSSAVTLHMADKVPLLVEFAFENGHVRYYLAPKLAEVRDMRANPDRRRLILAHHVGFLASRQMLPSRSLPSMPPLRTWQPICLVIHRHAQGPGSIHHIFIVITSTMGRDIWVNVSLNASVLFELHTEHKLPVLRVR